MEITSHDDYNLPFTYFYYIIMFITLLHCANDFSRKAKDKYYQNRDVLL